MNRALLKAVLCCFATAICQTHANQGEFGRHPSTGAEHSQTSGLAYKSYAENLYRDLHEFSNGKIAFKVRETAHGSLADLRNLSIGDLLAHPSATLLLNEEAISVEPVRFESDRVAESFAINRTIRLSDFERHGLPLQMGRYRKFEVETMVGAAREVHESIEFCWAEQGHCVVEDNSIPWLDGLVRGVRGRRADGWKMEITHLNGTAQAKTTNNCRLNSNIAASTSTTTKPAYSVRKENALGQLLYKGTIGKAEAVFRCTVNQSDRNKCDMNASSSVGGSNGSAYRSYSVACPSPAHINPELTNRGKVEVVTGCAFSQPGSTAKFSLSIVGQGMSADIVYGETVGNVSSNVINRSDMCLPLSYQH